MSGETEVGEQSVLEFGESGWEEPRRRPTADFLRGLAGDRRLPVLTAGLSAVAVFASLISEWQITAVEQIEYEGDEELSQQTQLLPTDLFDLGGIGGAYLVGLFLLTTSVVLVLFGPAAGRRYARLAGFSVGGLLFALLLAMVHLLGSETRLISRYFSMQMPPEQSQVEYGRGLWCALAGVAAALLVLWLTSREPDSDDGPRWVRPVAEEEDEDEPDAPLDLTISASTPFAPFPGQRDQPHRS
ncbi:hypothetical protein [Actinoplanes aureus]|uniref:Uncharacterized protein n=1 Tax=Actinoplanes aureus TaxID=2792083 RepID=A0A931C712_9ACTN|nr:hypothetical protein [Actinoplanes aureus]MBG0560643.1 hypothetical protein [Actinoplanes aureus]